jgi:hypothetical protein
LETSEPQSVFRVLNRILCAATPPGRLPMILVGENERGSCQSWHSCHNRPR